MKCFYIHYFATDNAKRNKIECKELENDISSVSVVVILFFFWYHLHFRLHETLIGIVCNSFPWFLSSLGSIHRFSFNWCSIFTNIPNMLVYWFCSSIAHQSLLACFDLANFQLNLFFWFNQFHYISSICYYLLLKFDYTFKRHREYDDRNLNT